VRQLLLSPAIPLRLSHAVAGSLCVLPKRWRWRGR